MNYAIIYFKGELYIKEILDDFKIGDKIGDGHLIIFIGTKKECENELIIISIGIKT